jgi:hypothetical protein
MDEKRENAAEREKVIADLGMADMRKFTTEQLTMCRRAEMEKANKTALERVEAALKDKGEDILKALTSPPFTYLSPKIKVMAGCEVRFTTLMKNQVDDSHRELDEFIAAQDPNQLRIADSLNNHLLAHGLAYYNDGEFGGVVFDAGDYQRLRGSNAEDARKMIGEVRDKRLAALGDLSPHVHQRLIEYWQAFQMTVEIMTQGAEDTLGN